MVGPATVAPRVAAADPDGAPVGETYERRFPTWVPWTVAGGGAVTLGIGVLLQFNARSLMDEYDRGVASECAVTGCDFNNPQPGSREAQLIELRDRAESRNTMSVVTLGVGAAALATGIVLLVLNEPRRRPMVNANVTGDAATATVRWSF